MAHLGVDRHLAEEQGAELLGQLLAAAAREDLVVVPARRADVVAHVLDDAEDRDLDLLEHRDRLDDVDERDLLRRGHHHRAGDRDELRQRELRVAGAGRQIDDQVVEVAPVDVLDELLQELVDHRAAPHDRAVALDEEADRDDLDAPVDRRRDLACPPAVPAARRARRASSAPTGRRRRRRAGRRSRRAAAAPAPGWSRPSTCRRRPCRRRPR